MKQASCLEAPPARGLLKTQTRRGMVMPNKNRKMIAFFSLLGIVALIVAACGGDDEPTARPTAVLPTAVESTPRPTATSASSLADPIRGGMLQAVQHLTIRGMDPLLNVCTGTCSVNRPFFNKLISVNKADGATAEPELATSWDVSGDGKVYTFNLRAGVKFHDGSDLTAEDVVHSVDRIQNPEKFEALGAPRNLRDTSAQRAWEIVTNAEAIDPTTVRFTLSKFSDSWFNSMLEVRATFYVVPSDVDVETLNEEGIGSGPFILDSVKFDEKIEMSANPNYWNTDASGRPYPYLDAVEVFIISDSSALLAAFTTGQVLWERPVSANRVAGRQDELRRQIPGLQIAPLASTLNAVMLNNRNPALRDPRVREAIDLALNRHAINQASTNNTAIVFHGVSIPPELNGTWSLPKSLFEDRPGYHLDPVKRAVDLEAAQALMRAAGFGPGNPLRLRTVARGSSIDEITVTMDSLRDIWIETDSDGIVDTGPSDTAEFQSQNWDISWFFFFSGSPYPGFGTRDQFSSRFNDLGWLSNPWDYSTVDPLWEEFDSISDRARQGEIFDEIQMKFLELRYVIGAYRTALFHSWWPALRNMPRSQCCTVADVVEDFEGFWIDRNFEPFGSLTEGDTPIYARP